jgi:glycosyltransferase involved in cell wall biosynthesis
LAEPDAGSLAGALIDATSDDAALPALIAGGRARAAEFTWERSAEEHARVWRAVR